MPTEALVDFFKKYPSLKNQSDYAVAVSGGPDSMALSHALVRSYPDKTFHLLGVDHGLRAESLDEVEAVEQFFSKDKNVTHKILQWQGDKPTSAVMEEARKARYDLMIDYCNQNNIQTLFIGHHQDDQAETFLIRLSKGSGLDGLSAMRSLTKNKDIYLARPFLYITKNDIIAYCQQNKIEYSADPSNENSNYLRPRLRQSKEILEKEGLSSKRLSLTAKRLSRAQEALNFYTDQLKDAALIEVDDQQATLDFTALQAAPYEVSLRVVQNLIGSYRQGYDYQVRMEKLEDLFESLITDPKEFKPRTLGGCQFSLKDKQTKLIIEKETK